MNVDINYGSLNRSSFVERHILHDVQQILDKVPRPQDTSVTVWLDNENPPTSAGLPEYKCTLSVQTGGQTLLTQKKHPRFLRCLHLTRDAMKKKLRREHKKFLSKRHRQEKATLPSETP